NHVFYSLHRQHRQMWWRRAHSHINKWICRNCQKEGSAILKRRSLRDYGWRTYVDFAGRVTLILGGLAWFVKEFSRKCVATGHKFAVNVDWHVVLLLQANV